MEYVTKYEAAHGKGSVSTFGAHAWDAGLLLANAVPVALKKAQPGTKEFRAALRDALEGTKNLPAAHGVFNMSATGPPRFRPARARHGQDRERHLEARQVSARLRLFDSDSSCATTIVLRTARRGFDQRRWRRRSTALAR